jgi:dTDP-4-dehydrorhamnose reductase
MRIVVLGKNGFVGKAIDNYFSNSSCNTISYDHEMIDFMNSSSFKNYTPLNDDVIIDAIANTSNKGFDALNVNYFGLLKFLKYINGFCINYQYIYLSTYSVLISDIRIKSSYVRSKAAAELLIKNYVSSFKIVRLIFPIGIGQRTERMLPRLIKSIKDGEILDIERLSTNLTPVSFFVMDLENIVESKKLVINYSNGVKIYLPELLNHICSRLMINRNFRIVGEKKELIVDDPFGIKLQKKIIYREVDKVIDSFK